MGEVTVDGVAGEEGAEGIEEAMERDEDERDGDAALVGLEINGQAAQHAAVVEFANGFVGLHFL